MNTLLRLFTSQPQLLHAHATAYLKLVNEQGELSLRLLGKRALWMTLAFGGFMVGTTLTGITVLIWLAFEPVTHRWLWAALLVPSTPLLVGLWAIRQAKRVAAMTLGPALRQQLGKDLTLFTTSTL